ncbi:MAG: lipoprotein-releasing ABC transporter permease subunit [Gammaproteobacteria bacterium]
MLRPYELFVATRHLRSRNRNRFVSFISLISVVGIALSVAVLIVVLSVMNGFDQEVRNRILAVIPHASIIGMEERLSDWEELADIAAFDSEVDAIAPYVEAQGMLVSEGGAAGIQFRGVLPEREGGVSGAGELLGEAALQSLKPRSYQIIIGRELANRLNAKVGDRLILMTAKGAMTPVGLVPRMRRFEVASIFYAGMYEFDRSLAYMHLDDAARLTGNKGFVTGVSLAVKEPLQASETVRRVARAYGGGVYVSDWTREHANFFRSIELTKGIIFIILLLVVAVAAFNIVSTLVMVVREKASEIAILRSMGASAASVLVVFVIEGTLIGLVGVLAGLMLGLGLAVNLSDLVAVFESLLGISFVAPDVYFISELPSDVKSEDVVRITVIAFLLAVLATIYPALKAAATNPAKALRYD